MEARELAEHIKALTPLSQSATRLLEVLKSEDSSLQDVTKIVELDPMLTANVLKVVNAPAFGLGRSVTSIARAVSFLGDKTVVGIAIASCAPGIYGTELKGYEAEKGRLWEHSLHVAIASREVLRHARPGVKVAPEDAFTAGILHDIGKAVVAEYLSEHAEELGARIAADDAAAQEHAQTAETAGREGAEADAVHDFTTLERDLVGVDHALAGLALGKHWHLPPDTVAAIRYHHTPSKAPEEARALAFAVHLGDLLAQMAGTGTGADTLHYELDPGFEIYFELSEADIDQLSLDAAIEFEKTRTAFFD